MTPIKTIHFNTGRKYTAHGQRITATLYDNGKVTFHDHDRMIAAEYDMDFFMPVEHCFTPRSVQYEYDHNNYGTSTKADHDAFIGTGINAVYKGD